MPRIADSFEGSVFIPGHGSFRAGDELPRGAQVGDHVPTVTRRVKDEPKADHKAE